ncbi:MAG: glycosyltransferase family 4 protein, partial [Acidimicrobiia bacterium]
PDPPAQLRLLGAVWDERFDVLHLHEPIAPGPTLTSLVVKPAPLLGTFHASGTIMPYRWINGVVRQLAGRLDYRVAVSDEAASTARQSLGGDYRIIPNAIEVDRFSEAEPWPTQAPTVMFIGRHEERKGLRVLLESLAHLPGETTFWIAGQGPDTESLKEEFGDSRIHWLGAVSDDEKQRRLAGADAFCVPAVGGESFGVVLLEGMAARTPVVASDIAAFRFVAQEGACATLFENRSPTRLAEALLVALAGGPEIESKVTAGIERAQEYSMNVQARVYAEIYQALANGEMPPGEPGRPLR